MSFTSNSAPPNGAACVFNSRQPANSLHQSSLPLSPPLSLSLGHIAPSHLSTLGNRPPFTCNSSSIDPLQSQPLHPTTREIRSSGPAPSPSGEDLAPDEAGSLPPTPPS